MDWENQGEIFERGPGHGNFRLFHGDEFSGLKIQDHEVLAVGFVNSEYEVSTRYDYGA